MAVVMYGCETWLVTAMEEHELLLVKITRRARNLIVDKLRVVAAWDGRNIEMCAMQVA